MPVVPGTKGLVESEEEALKESERIGYPVMLKATGGGGGMGLVVCDSADEVKEGFKSVRSRGQALFKSTSTSPLTYHVPKLTICRPRPVHRAIYC